MPKMPSNIKNVLLKIMQVTESSLEGAQYALTRFKKLVDANKMGETLKGMVGAVETFVEDVNHKFSSEDGRWNGKVKEEPSEAILNGRTQKAAEILKGLNVVKVDFAFAVNENSQFIRGYSSNNGEPLQAESIKNMDKSFNSFLASHNIKSEGSVFYKTENEKIVKDSKGSPVKVNPDEVSKLITKEFPEYMKKQDIEINCNQQPYPTAGPAAKEEAEAGMRTR